MNFYVEIKNGFPFNTDGMCAVEGAEMLGHTVKTFTKETAAMMPASKFLNQDNVFVGSIDVMKRMFRYMNCVPADLDFPHNVLERPNWLKRNVSRTTVREAWENFEKTHIPVHIKPIETKLFDAVILDNNARAYLRTYMDNEAWVSDIIEMKSEWRAFVHNNRLVDFRPYKGNVCLQAHPAFVNGNIMSFNNAPCAYVIDVALDKEGDDIVVEYGDFWSVGSYGLEPQLYAQMLIDRFNEIRNK